MGHVLRVVLRHVRFWLGLIRPALDWLWTGAGAKHTCQAACGQWHRARPPSDWTKSQGLGHGAMPSPGADARFGPVRRGKHVMIKEALSS